MIIDPVYTKPELVQINIKLLPDEIVDIITLLENTKDCKYNAMRVRDSLLKRLKELVSGIN